MSEAIYTYSFTDQRQKWSYQGLREDFMIIIKSAVTYDSFKSSSYLLLMLKFNLYLKKNYNIKGKGYRKFPWENIYLRMLFIEI